MSRRFEGVVNRRFVIGLLSFVLGIAFTFVGARTVAVILLPGAVVAERWLHVDFGSRAYGVSVFALDILIYTGAFAVILWLIGVIASWFKDKISN